MLLDNIGVQEIPLRQEIDFVKKYVEIEQLRFPDKLELEMEIDPDTLDALVPTMLMQPLVENSLRHGLNLMQCNGLIRISAHGRDDKLHLRISDNGCGVTSTEGIREGLGIKNTRLRLKQFFGTNHLFRIETPSQGFSVYLEIPFRTGLPSDQSMLLE
jgi:LytS/YehU family sensor histidine kinase